MPELPDVQVFKEYVDATSLHHRIRGVAVHATGLLDGVSSRTLARRLRRHQLASTRRHGKHLFVRVTGDGWVRLHFGMTGRLAYLADDERPPKHTRLHLTFTNGHALAWINVRRLGRIGLVDDVDGFVAAEGLGPDALSIDLAGFRRALEGRRGTIKSALMNQQLLAGLGNIFVDELLFAAGVDPRSDIRRLTPSTVRDLHRAMRRVLRRAIRARAVPERLPRDFLLPHRSPDGRCPRCGRPWATIRVGGRATYFCPRDQRRRR